MTIELTHEQAAMMLGAPELYKLHTHGLIRSIGPGLRVVLSDRGRQALAAYHAKWRVVEKRHLQCAEVFLRTGLDELRGKFGYKVFYEYAQHREALEEIQKALCK